MLWFKAWAESRTRFAIAAVAMAAAAAFVLGWQDAQRLLFGGFHRTMFIVVAFVLGMGGVVREHELGTSAFTLSLPATRRRLTVIRVIVGLGELLALAAMTLVVVIVAASIVRHPYPVERALMLTLRWMVGGSALFAVAFLASVAVPGEYNAFVVAIVVFFAHTVTTQFIRIAKPPMLPYMFTVQEVMSGTRPHLAVPTIVTLAIGATLLAAAVVWTDRKDF